MVDKFSLHCQPSEHIACQLSCNLLKDNVGERSNKEWNVWQANVSGTSHIPSLSWQQNLAATATLYPILLWCDRTWHHCWWGLVLYFVDGTYLLGWKLESDLVWDKQYFTSHIKPEDSTGHSWVAGDAGDSQFRPFCKAFSLFLIFSMFQQRYLINHRYIWGLDNSITHDYFNWDTPVTLFHNVQGMRKLGTHLFQGSI